jgi:hypothetical protein
MSRMGTARKLFVIAAATLLVGGCKDSGLPGKNTEHEQAQVAEWRYPVYEALPAGVRVIPFDGHVWQMTGQTQHMPVALLHSVASVNGADLFALKSDSAPYDRLYSGSAGNYSVVARLY